MSGLSTSRPAGFPALPAGVRLAVVGLGYVGLPLAVEFGRTMDVVGFDINGARVKELSTGTDHTLEVEDEALAGATGLRFSEDPDDIAD